jgi:predicted phage tail protein
MTVSQTKPTYEQLKGYLQRMRAELEFYKSEYNKNRLKTLNLQDIEEELEEQWLEEKEQIMLEKEQIILEKEKWRERAEELSEKIETVEKEKEEDLLKLQKEETAKLKEQVAILEKKVRDQKPVDQPHNVKNYDNDWFMRNLKEQNFYKEKRRPRK